MSQESLSFKETEPDNGLTVIYYRNEAGRDILFGFFKVPEQVNLTAAIEDFRREQPRHMSLTNWLIQSGAESMAELDRQYRQNAQRGAAKGQEGLMPIYIQLEEIKAEPFELTW